ncbi:hypothetical protein BKA61DRAFT_44454 [Leptodontidium sp. MPI-SDFR-AT-0119]|nr:hypothetical protein BKA61DRAFT_44454 [Leptodontidium sp. MPI-SDFR-AT-0119]
MQILPRLETIGTHDATRRTRRRPSIPPVSRADPFLFPADRTAALEKMSQTDPSRPVGLVCLSQSVGVRVICDPTFPFLIIPPSHHSVPCAHPCLPRGRSAAVTIEGCRSWYDQAGRRHRDLGIFPEQTFATGFSALLNSFIQLVVPGYRVFHVLRPQDRRCSFGFSTRSSVTTSLPKVPMTRTYRFLVVRTCIEALPSPPGPLLFVIDRRARK